MTIVMEPTVLDDLALRAGHRDLLDTLRELMSGIGRTSGRLDQESLRAAVAFLQQGLVPFARREELSLPPGDGVREAIAFEHAFLHAEIERLAREAAPILRRGPAESPECTDSVGRVWRTLCRIEAVLELHVFKEEDRVVPGATSAEPSSPDPTPDHASRPAPSGSPEAMDRDELDRYLRTHRWGVLGTVGDGDPYGVPVFYGYDGHSFFIATSPGRKSRNLDQGGVVCLTVPEIQDGERWRCAVVRGNVERLTTLAARAAATWALLGTRRPRTPPSSKELSRFAKARLFRIVPIEMTGRRRGI
jgi:nitroimidazol reductase NimA-like FMN-containing flavoprotein (pyridoxamine 5'-phosphate oxidase superfamily)